MFSELMLPASAESGDKSKQEHAHCCFSKGEFYSIPIQHRFFCRLCWFRKISGYRRKRAPAVTQTYLYSMKEDFTTEEKYISLKLCENNHETETGGRGIKLRIITGIV
ncbi:MAG: hypothetical protein D3904_17400 [Candidatus Electrothrix sp. EH2]|nr:hypothetical protein [Candidatus Electrothrix sp. EH2]